MEESQALVLPKKADGTPVRFLCVDDSEFMLKSLRQILTSFGGEVLDFAKDGLEGFQKYQAASQLIDIVTLDITMPVMDGLQCLDKIREFNPQAKVIMISALGSGDIVKKAILAGAQHFIVKPFQRQKVFEASVAVMNSKR